MAQATNGQTKAGTAGRKTERVLVHQKGEKPEDQLDRLWMDGIPSKAPGRTAGSLEQTLDHVERSSSALKQFAASTLLKNEDGLLDLTIPPGWRGFLRRLQACQLAAVKRRWDIWTGVTARLLRVRRQVASSGLQAG